MTKLKNKYVIGCHVMFYEIEIYKEYIDGLINLLKTIDNKENIDRILLDRIQEINIEPLSVQEKLIITKSYICPEIYKNIGFTSNEIIFDNDYDFTFD